VFCRIGRVHQNAAPGRSLLSTVDLLAAALDVLINYEQVVHIHMRLSKTSIITSPPGGAESTVMNMTFRAGCTIHT